MINRVFLYLLIATLSFSSLPNTGVMAKGSPAGDEPPSSAVVCPPDVYLNAPGDCLPLGPSTYLTEMAKPGLTFPPRALPAYKPDPVLTQLPYFYFKLEEDIVPVLSGPGGDIAGQSFLSGFVYVSYMDRVYTGHGIYYMLPGGGWIPGKGSRIFSLSGATVQINST
jgi:hypothetical protein